MKVQRSLWCCSSVERPIDILFHSAVTELQMLPIGSLFYQTQTPLLLATKRVARQYADSWNWEYDFVDSLRVVPRRITVSIDVGATK